MTMMGGNGSGAGDAAGETTPQPSRPGPNSPIPVLLVDDSPIALSLLRRLLARTPDIQVVGTAAHGGEALALLPRLNPAVICTDLHMPVMDGLALTRAVMQDYPRPILVVSVSVEGGSAIAFRLLEAGAVDIYPKPRAILHADQDALARELARRIRVVAGVRVFRRCGSTPPAPLPPLLPATRAPVRMVAIGTSTGGPQALRELLSHLPAGFPAPVVCVQHIGDAFIAPMADWLAEVSPMPVRMASAGEPPRAGTIWFAPGGAHLEFDGRGCFALSDAAPCDGHRPSATVLLSAAARRFGAGAVGVLLTGMGGDGARGMAAIAAAGGATMVQDEASCVVYGMPRAAVALGAAQQILPLEQIAPALVALASRQRE